MPITTATCTRIPAVVGRSMTTAVGTASRTAPRRSRLTTTRLLDLRATSVPRLPLGVRAVGVEASAVLIVVMVVAVEAASVGSTVVVEDLEVLAEVVVGIVVAGALAVLVV